MVQESGERMKQPTEKSSHRPGPLVLLLVLMGLLAVALASLKALEPGVNVITWSWIAYGIGGIIIFFVLSRKRKRKPPHVIDGAKNGEATHGDDGPISLDEVRRRIQRRRREKNPDVKE